MLILPFKIADDNFAVGIDSIKEIIPVVDFNKLPSSPDYVKGLINYRGSVCPVLDVSMLIKNKPSKIFLSTRIIMIDMKNVNCSFGLLAEQVTETTYIDENDFINISAGLTTASYIDKTIIINGKIVQFVNP